MNPEHIVLEVECTNCKMFYTKQTLLEFDEHCPYCNEDLGIINVETNGEPKTVTMELLGECVDILSPEYKGESAWRVLLKDLHDGIEKNWEYFKNVDDSELIVDEEEIYAKAS